MICIFLFEQNDSKQIIRKSMQIMPKKSVCYRNIQYGFTKATEKQFIASI